MPRQLEVIQGKQSAACREETPKKERGFMHVLPPFEEALLSHFESLFAFALRLLNGRRERAEDLVQEACLRAFRHYQSLRSPEKIRSWFFKILVNTHINQFHQEERQVPIDDIELSEALLTSHELQTEPSPEQHFFDRVLDAEVQQALDALPAEFREVVWLADVERFSYQEISEIASCSLGTVGSRLYRGRSLLREQLREYARQRGLLRE